MDSAAKDRRVNKLDLDPGLIRACHESAAQIARQTLEDLNGNTTVSIERATARLLGVDGIDEHEVPLPNVLVEQLRGEPLRKGLSYWLGNAMAVTGRRPRDIAEMAGDRTVDLSSLPVENIDAGRRAITAEATKAVGQLQRQRKSRERLRTRLGERPPPHAYVLTATGNVYEDVVHARAVAQNGGDIVAVIRSTAQSLLDFVPYGPTVEGFGGTFATQANFRILRNALDEWSSENGRYVRLSSFCSGLCMPEIAAIGAMEGLDNMVNDALYGILYRDINMIRTLTDQRISRLINGYSGIVINTGEDNYLRTADAVKAAPSVAASQLINYFIAIQCGVPEEQIAIGNSFEIDPRLPDGLLLEWAQAQLTRELFPNCPVKYMPPTKHMNGNLFRTHACDTLFNLVTVATHQEIQTIGVPTEGLFTPHIHDRVHGLESVQYVFNSARSLGDEIVFRPGGMIQRRAHEVLQHACALLEEIREIGLPAGLERGMFGDVSRCIDGGKGKDGVVKTDEDYFNPLIEQMNGGPYAVQ